MKLSIREMNVEDIQLVVDYFFSASTSFLEGMGADKRKLPDRDKWIAILKEEFFKEPACKNVYYVIWQIDGNPIGHSNINHIKYKQEAYMHLHIWDTTKRQKGIGLWFLNQTIPLYFKNFKLKELFCEPYSLNPAPNKILKKLGFEFVKQYDTIPGAINFHQTVNQYKNHLCPHIIIIWKLNCSKYISNSGRNKSKSMEIF